ncbi:hypothetical protein C8Q76DRAFT_732298 [Earliella scabrosa]|nr:hypothetical protein C8Q76DRAFT_732298 [Earliella scabrosa]
MSAEASSLISDHTVDSIYMVHLSICCFREMFTLVHTVHQVPPGTIGPLRRGEPDHLRSLLKDCRPSIFIAMVDNNDVIKQWLESIQGTDLHLILRTRFYPSITIYDQVGRTIHMHRDVFRAQTVDRLLPKGLDDRVILQLPEGIPLGPVNAIECAIHSLDLHALPELLSGMELRTVAPWGFPPEGDVHLVLTSPTRGANEDMVPSHSEFAQRRWSYFKNAPARSPSSDAQPSQFAAVQSDPTHHIYCGRPLELCTPASLMDEILCQLRHDIYSITPTPRDVRCYQALREVACRIFPDEAARRQEFTAVLEDGGILPQGVSRGVNDDTGFHSDGDLRVSCLNMLLFAYVQEIRLEVGTGNADPFVKAIHYWLEQVRVAIKQCTDPKLQKINFPTIIVLHFGPYIAIGGAVYTDQPNAEHFCCIPLHVHSTNNAELEAGERALAALRVAISSLQERYPTLHKTRRPRADFPFRDCYEDEKGDRHAFTYIEAIEGKRIFRVRHDSDGTPLIVKFTKSYSAAAHRLAHETGFAPALRAVNNVYDWVMVVMDDESADYSDTLWDLKARENKITMGSPQERREADAASLEHAQQAVMNGLRRLHELGYVHGDVRDVNVLVRNKDAPCTRPDVLLVDWDWAGLESDARYPRNLNSAVPRPAGAASGERITAAHDLWMAERLLDSWPLRML